MMTIMCVQKQIFIAAKKEKEYNSAQHIVDAVLHSLSIFLNDEMETEDEI